MIHTEDIHEHIGDHRNSADLETQCLTNGQLEAHVYFYKSLCDIKIIRDCISEPLAKCKTAEDFKGVLNSELSCKRLDDVEQIRPEMLKGNALIAFEGKLWALSAAKVINDKPGEATNETSVQGPIFALTENSTANINLIRHRYPSPNLIVEEKTVGIISKTKLSILYDKQLVNESVLNELFQKLDRVRADVVQAVGQLEALLSQKKFRLFPVTLLTERPDRIALNLAQGKVVILMQGSNFALIAPAVFYDFMSAMDDMYQSFWVSNMLIVLRYIALFITITLPAMYIAVISHNPEVFRIQFTLSIAGSRAAVPYPSFIEVFIMLFIIEALIESSIRLPKFIAQTTTTVGGLILGQAAQQAGLISSIMIIIASAVAIANFVIPINAMSFAIRIVKYPLIILAIFFGIVGVIIGVFCFLLYLANMKSFGEPYLRLFLGEHSPSGYKQGDSA